MAGTLNKHHNRFTAQFIKLPRACSALLYPYEIITMIIMNVSGGNNTVQVFYQTFHSLFLNRNSIWYGYYVTLTTIITTDTIPVPAVTGFTGSLLATEIFLCLIKLIAQVSRVTRLMFVQIGKELCEMLMSASCWSVRREKNVAGVNVGFHLAVYIYSQVLYLFMIDVMLMLCLLQVFCQWFSVLLTDLSATVCTILMYFHFRLFHFFKYFILLLLYISEANIALFYCTLAVH